MKKLYGFIKIVSIGLCLPLQLLSQDSTTNSTVQNSLSDSTALKSSVYYSLQKRFHKDENDTLRIDKFGFTVKPSINFGAGLRMRRHKDKQPFAYEHSLIAYYAINRASFYIEYQSLWNQAIGDWNLALRGRLDIPNSVFFFGVGNETKMRDDIKRKYYRLYSTEFTGSVAINRMFNQFHFVEVSPFFQNIDVRIKEDQFIKDYLPRVSAEELSRNYFVGTAATYGYTKTNNPLTPTKGFAFNVGAAYTMSIRNRDNNDRDFTRYTSSASTYLPLSRAITLALRVGGATLRGDPAFYQLNRLGGNETLRGYRRQRFYGKHAFYNNNELRFLWLTQNRLFDGKLGFVAFADQGRVWQPGEKSDTWHVGFGGGPVIQVFNQLLINGSYGFSKEDRVLHLRLGYLF